MGELAIDSQEVDHALVIRLEGMLDLSTAPALRSRLLDAAQTPRPVVVDMAGLSFMDSAGLGVIVSAFNRLRRVGGRLVLASPEPRVRNVLEVTQVDRAITVCDTTGEAVEATAPPPT